VHELLLDPTALRYSVGFRHPVASAAAAALRVGLPLTACSRSREQLYEFTIGNFF